MAEKNALGRDLEILTTSGYAFAVLQASVLGGLWQLASSDGWGLLGLHPLVVTFLIYLPLNVALLAARRALRSDPAPLEWTTILAVVAACAVGVILAIANEPVWVQRALSITAGLYLIGALIVLAAGAWRDLAPVGPKRAAHRAHYLYGALRCASLVIVTEATLGAPGLWIALLMLHRLVIAPALAMIALRVTGSSVA